MIGLGEIAPYDRAAHPVFVEVFDGAAWHPVAGPSAGLLACYLAKQAGRPTPAWEPWCFTDHRVARMQFARHAPPVDLRHPYLGAHRIVPLSIIDDIVGFLLWGWREGSR